MKNKKLLLATFSLLISSNFTFGQINLGTASSFVLFTSVGAIDNVGPSNFVGDIGTNAGAITGFPPGTLTGVIHQENPTTLQAAADVESAYNDLTGVPCDSLIGNALGGGQILTPYVYCVSTAASLTGELILDGEGDPNAVFMIKITGLIDAIGLSTVTLINSATANNVYWQIDGAVNIGAGAIFKGVILANGALSFADGADFTGNGLCRQGAISTSTNTATVPIVSGMAIELIEFQGENKHTRNLLFWSTASETNNSHFTLERTTDGIYYIELARINGAGTSTSTHSYSYTDFNFEKKQNYYRLKQTDYDGAYETFGLISIDNFNGPSGIVRVVNMLGQEVDRESTELRIIYFNNGEILKIDGTYVQNQ